MDIYYVVDASNHVMDVDSAWDDRARAAGGPGALRRVVLGQPLDRFLAGDATLMFMRSALEVVRLTGRPRVLPYRCDSPEERRRFEMQLSMEKEGAVRVAHRLVEATPRRAPVAARSARLAVGWRCSQCLAVRRPGSAVWEEPDEAHARLLAQDVCGPCSARLFATVSSAR